MKKILMGSLIVVALFMIVGSMTSAFDVNAQTTEVRPQGGSTDFNEKDFDLSGAPRITPTPTASPTTPA